MEETKIIYHIDDEDTPYLIKLPVPSDQVTLGDFKNALNRPNYKFFFKSMDDDFGVVKEEIIDDDTHLPCFNGRVVSWLVPAESSVSDTQSCNDSQAGDIPKLPAERLGGIGDSRPPSFHAGNASTRELDQDACDTCTETESVLSSRRDGPRHSQFPPNARGPLRDPRDPNYRHPHQNHAPRMNGHSRHRGHGIDATSSVMSSDIDTTSFFDSEDDASSRFTTGTENTRGSSKYGRHRRRRRRHRMPPISRASSFSSITDSTMSLNIITVTLNMDTVNFLGISIVGQSNKGGDGGIYVGSIMKGGAVAQDGRIEPGDMILEVNGVSFENMSNDDAVRTLREAVQKPGPITLVVAKCWDPNPKGYFTIPRQEPVRPIDPSAWVAHTNALRNEFGGGGAGPGPGPGAMPGRLPGPMSPSLSTVTSTSSSLTSSLPESERFDNLNLTVNTDMATVVKAMAQPDSGLEIRDRMWLKITIPNAFIGSDLVDWLHTHVEGFADRRDARKYATNLLKAGYIRHTVNKLTFSEQCYYVFGDLCGVPGLDFESGLYSSGSNLLPNLATNMSSLTLEDIDSVSEVDRDTLAPLPPPSWNNVYHNPYGPSPAYIPPPPPGAYIPPKPYNYPPNETASYVSMPQGNGSIHSGSVRALTDLTVAPDVCLELCLPFWKCPALGKPPKHLQARVAPPRAVPKATPPQVELNNNRMMSKDGTPWSLKNSAAVAIDKETSGKKDEGSTTETGSSASGGSDRRNKEKNGDAQLLLQQRKSDASGGSETETGSVVRAPPSERSLPPPPLDLNNTNQDLSASRQSFRMAMGNPYGEDTLTDMGEL